MATYAKRGAMLTCSLCTAAYVAKGYCAKHYMRFRIHGDATIVQRAPNGSGCVSNGGYRVIHKTGRQVTQSRLIVERVLGRPLAPKTQVHHVSKNKTDNNNNNLVVCLDQAYHKLLHRRTEALEACGNANWRKCQHCQQWDAPFNLVIDRMNKSFHRVCHNTKAREHYAARMAIK